MLDCYDVIVYSEEFDESFEVLVWAKNHILAKKYIINELRKVEVGYRKITIQKVKIYNGKILHLN